MLASHVRGQHLSGNALLHWALQRARRPLVCEMKSKPRIKETRMPDTEASVGKVPFLINRNFAVYLPGRLVSLIGDQMFATTLVIWIATTIARRPDGSFEAWGPLATSGLVAATAVPTILFSPLAGV